MIVINPVSLSKGRGRPYSNRSTTGFCLLGTMMLLCSVNSALAQRGSNQFMNGDPSVQWTVSKNQLLTPQKALRATSRARDELLHGRIDSARKQVAHALDIAPQCALALDLQGVINIKNGHLDDAASSFQRAIENDPALGAAYVGLGMVFIGQGHFRDALTPLDRATALLPNTWIVHFESGMAHLGLGETEKALEQATLADHIAETDQQGKSAIFLLHALIQLRLQDIPRARIYLIQTIDSDPNGSYAPLARRALERLQPSTANSR